MNFGTNSGYLGTSIGHSTGTSLMDMTKSNIPALPQNGHNRANSKELDVAAPPFARKNTSGEYGRLFIKVVKLKDLELPLPKGIPLAQQANDR